MLTCTKQNGATITLKKKRIDKYFKKLILNELEEYYSISYETLMIPDSNNLRIDLEFKNFVDKINQSSNEINEAYKKWKITNQVNYPDKQPSSCTSHPLHTAL